MLRDINSKIRGDKLPGNNWHVNAPANAPVKLNKTQLAIIKVLLKDNRATYEDLAKIIGVDRIIESSAKLFELLACFSHLQQKSLARV